MNQTQLAIQGLSNLSLSLPLFNVVSGTSHELIERRSLVIEFGAPLEARVRVTQPRRKQLDSNWPPLPHRHKTTHSNVDHNQ